MVLELRAFLRFPNYYKEFVRLYADHAAPVYSVIPLSKSEAQKGSNHPLHGTLERGAAFRDLKRELLDPLPLFSVIPNKPFMIRTDAHDYAMGAILEQNDEKGNHYPVAFWSRVLTPSQRKSWTARTKKAYATTKKQKKEGKQRNKKGATPARRGPSKAERQRGQRKGESHQNVPGWRARPSRPGRTSTRTHARDPGVASFDPQGEVSASTRNSPGAPAESPVKRWTVRDTGRVSDRFHTRQPPQRTQPKTDAGGTRQ